MIKNTNFLQRHVQKLIAKYVSNSSRSYLHEKNHEDVIILNLLNMNGSEAALGKAFNESLQNCCQYKISDEMVDKNLLQSWYRFGSKKLDESPIIKHSWLDYHSVFRHGRSRLQDYVSKITHSFLAQHNTLGNYMIRDQLSNGLLSEQSGIIRTNCVDCIDRTNVVQVGYKFFSF